MFLFSVTSTLPWNVHIKKLDSTAFQITSWLNSPFGTAVQSSSFSKQHECFCRINYGLG